MPETYCIDPDLVEAAITPRTKAIIAVHMGGHPADLDRLSQDREMQPTGFGRGFVACARQ